MYIVLQSAIRVALLYYGVPKGSKSTEVVDHSVYAYFDMHVHA